MDQIHPPALLLLWPAGKEVSGDVGNEVGGARRAVIEGDLPVAADRDGEEFGTVWPAVKFSFEALGRAVPEG